MLAFVSFAADTFPFFTVSNISIGSLAAIAKIKYDEMMEKIEWMSKFLHAMLVRFSFASYNLPPLLISLINFYALNLGDESFYMQAPTMCVKKRFGTKFKKI